MNIVKRLLPDTQASLPEPNVHKVSRRILIKLLIIVVLCALPIISLFRPRKSATQIVTFFMPVEGYGRFNPRENNEDREHLKMSIIRNDFIEIVEIRCVTYTDDDDNSSENGNHDVILTLEFVGEISETRRYRFEMIAMDEHNNVLVSAWNEAQDIRIITEKQNQSEYAKKHHAKFLPLYTLNFGAGITKDTFNKIVKIELHTTATPT